MKFKIFIKILMFVLLTNLFIETTNASPGINYLQNLTKTSNYSLSGATDITIEKSVPGYFSTTVNDEENQVYTFDVNGKIILVYDTTNGNLIKTIQIISNDSPNFKKVSSYYQKTSKKLFIYGITGVGDIKFPTNSNYNINGASNSFIIITVDVVLNTVESVFSVGSGELNDISDSFQVDSFDNFFINGSFQSGSTSQGFITKINSNGIISNVATFSNVLKVNSITENIGDSRYISGILPTNEYFITKINDTNNYNSVGTIFKTSNAKINDIYFNPSNNNIYVLLTFTGSKNINGINYTNTTGIDTLIITLDRNFNTTASYQFTGNGNIILDKMRISKDNDILVYGDYTESLTNPNIPNRGGTDSVIIKFRNNGTENFDFNGILLYLKSGFNSISGLSISDQNSYYYGIIDGNIFKFGNDSVYRSESICGVGSKPYWIPANFHTNSQRYSFGTILSDVKKMKDLGTEYEDDFITTFYNGSALNGIYSIVNKNFTYGGKVYSDGISTVNDKIIGNDKTGKNLTQQKITDNKAQLLDSIETSVKNNTILGNNSSSYYTFYKNKGFHPAMLHGKTMKYYVDWNDFRNPQTNNDKANLFVGKYIYGRNYTSSYKKLDTDTNKEEKGNPVYSVHFKTSDRFTTMGWGKVLYPVLPIKKVSNNSIAGYLQYPCGNLICSQITCFPDNKVINKPTCGNNNLEEGEVCDGELFANIKEIARLKGLGYNVSCNNCSIQYNKSNQIEDSYKTKILVCIPDDPKKIEDGFCGDGIIQNGTNGTRDLGEQCEIQTPGCIPGTCKFSPPPSPGSPSATCDDGIVQTLTEKIYLKLTNPNANIDFINEECDNGSENGSSGSSCTSNCVKKEDPPRCGDGKIDYGEDFDDGDQNSIEHGCKKNYEGYCGNNIIEENLGESCEGDDRNPIGYNPSNGEVCMDCKKWNPPSPPPSAYCGDGIIQSNSDKYNLKLTHSNAKIDFINEECDNGLENGSSRSSCDKGCKIRDPKCGNGIIESGEDFDDGDDYSKENNCKRGYCGNNTIEEKLGEDCEGDDSNPVGYNPSNGEKCIKCRKWNTDDPPFLTYCGDGIINKRVDGKNETCDLGSNSKGVWLEEGCGYPTITDSNNRTIPNPNACMKSVCGNGIVEDNEVCDNGIEGTRNLNDGVTIKNGGICNNTCTNFTPSTCGNNKIDKSEIKIGKIINNEFSIIKTPIVEQCDFGNDNGTNVVRNGIKCSLSCKIIPICSTDVNTTSKLNDKYNFIYVEPLTNPFKFEIWSFDKKTSSFTKKNAILPEISDFLKYYQNSSNYEVSSKTNEQLYVGKRKLKEGIKEITESKVFQRKMSSLLDINKNIQFILDKEKGFVGLSFSLSDIISDKTSSLRKFLFKYIIDRIDGIDIEVVTNSCSNNIPETQGSVNVIGIINGDNDSIQLVKNYGSIIPTGTLYK